VGALPRPAWPFLLSARRAPSAALLAAAPVRRVESGESLRARWRPDAIVEALGGGEAGAKVHSNLRV